MAKVSVEEVEAAARKLAAEGRNPSVDNVLAITGGSKTTVTSLMREVRARLTGVSPAPPPERLLGDASEFAGRIWETLRATAKAEHEAERAMLIRAHAAAEEDAARVSSELADVENAKAALEADLASTRQALAKASAGRDLAETRAAEVEARERELAERVATLTEREQRQTGQDQILAELRRLRAQIGRPAEAAGVVPDFLAEKSEF